LAVAQGDIALSLIEIYRALGGGWQIRLGGIAPEVTEPESLELFEEMPPPGAEDGVEVQSFVSQWSFLDQAEGEPAPKEAAATDTPATLNLESTAEQKSS
jgi:hypothetical protein